MDAYRSRPTDCAACPRDGGATLHDNPCAFASFCDAACNGSPNDGPQRHGDARNGDADAGAARARYPRPGDKGSVG